MYFDVLWDLSNVPFHYIRPYLGKNTWCAFPCQTIILCGTFTVLDWRIFILTCQHPSPSLLSMAQKFRMSSLDNCHLTILWHVCSDHVSFPLNFSIINSSLSTDGVTCPDVNAGPRGLNLGSRCSLHWNPNPQWGPGPTKCQNHILNLGSSPGLNPILKVQELDHSQFTQG